MDLPPLSCDDVLKFQFSSWYPVFRTETIKSTIIRPLSEEFHQYLLADGVFIPEGSENVPSQASLEEVDEDEHASDSEDDKGRVRYAFPELDAKIREAIAEYDGVFPKLNFSSPKDASWMLPSTSPMKCSSPADVYTLLKCSDFINHDVTLESVFEGCDPDERRPKYELELVLRKWYHVDRSREFRCFVVNNALLGISQREMNPYDYMLEDEYQTTIKSTIVKFWEQKISSKWPTTNYVFDILVTRNLQSGHILDFQPYAPKTDALLFTYEELRGVALAKSIALPILRVVDGNTHPSHAAPTNIHNMVPLEFLSLSNGQTLDDFQKIWADEIKNATSE